MKALDPLQVPLDGTVLVEASAGTGKTWTLAALYLRLLLERRLTVGQILVVTYTNAATAELRDRIRRRLREAVAVFDRAQQLAEGGVIDAPDDGDLLAALAARCRADGTLAQARKLLVAALRDFDEAAIFTIHGFCQRILLENAFESGVPFDAELVTDERPLYGEVVQDFWVRHLHDAPAVVVPYLQKECPPNALEKLARKVLASRDMPVLPESPPEVDANAVEALVAEWRAAHAAAAEAWSTCAEEVERLLDPAVLKNRLGKREGVRAACAELADLLSRAPDDPVDCESLELFTNEKLRANTRAAHRHATPAHPFFALCDRLHAAQCALQKLREDWALWLQALLVREVRDEVERRHEARRTQSFDDLLYRLRDALVAPGGGALAEQIRTRFRAALIDEFQDTDPVQYAIFRRVYVGSDAPLFLIGDPKQAIYAFRGADVFTYVEAKQNAGANAYTLQTNHRSAPDLVRAVNTLFKRVRDPFLFDAIPFTEVAAASKSRDELRGPIADLPPLEILYLEPPGGDDKPASKEWAKRQVPATIAADIVRLLAAPPTIGERPLHAGDVAVLCRTNRQAVEVQEALRRLGVPSVRQGDDSVLESDEAEEIERVLRAVAEPGDPRLLRAALATRLVGADATELAKLQNDELGWDEHAARFREWLDVWVAHGFMAAFQRLLEQCKTQARLLALEDGERRLTNVLHVAELLQAASRDAHHGPLALVDWLSALRNDPAASAELASEAAQVRLESDERAVQLVTIHRSKGLEYGIVYCPYTWDGTRLHDDDKRWVRFHDPKDGVLKLDVGSEQREAHQAQAALEAFAENLRLLYVAITRARHRCTVVWGRINADHESALGYLLHAPSDAGPDDLAAVQKRIQQLGRAERIEELTALAAASDGGIRLRVETAPQPQPEPLPPPQAGVELRAPLVAQRPLDGAWRVSSFSGLVASGGRTSHRAEEGLDHDATGATDAERAEARAAQRVVLHDLPSGARTGELLHAILERIDFQRGDRDELGRCVHETVKHHGFDARWEGTIARALDDVLATPIPFGDRELRLADVPSGKRLNELQFLFEVRRGFDREALARCFERHPSPARRADYPHRIRRLGFPALQGYLGGFIDLVFEHQGRWYVVDYKSNHLGPSADGYAPARLRDAMALHHYHLQYHLYVLAVQRYLTMRLPGFDPERDFGGVAYLFLRGMAPRHPRGCGVYVDRPAPELLAELSELVGPAAGGVAA